MTTINEISNRRAVELLDNALMVFEEKIDIEMYEKINNMYLQYLQYLHFWNSYSYDFFDIVDYLYVELEKENFNVDEITEQILGYSYFYDNVLFKDIEILKKVILKPNNTCTAN